VYVYPRADPCEPFPTIDGGSGDRTTGEAYGELMKNYQSAQGAQHGLDRKRPVTHPLCLGDGGLGGNEWLENALVQIRSVEVHNFEYHEHSDRSK